MSKERPWKVFKTEEGVQVLPDCDTDKHEFWNGCKCNPKVEVDTETEQLIIIHNAFDGREWEEMSLGALTS